MCFWQNIKFQTNEGWECSRYRYLYMISKCCNGNFSSFHMCYLSLLGSRPGRLIWPSTISLMCESLWHELKCSLRVPQCQVLQFGASLWTEQFLDHFSLEHCPVTHGVEDCIIVRGCLIARQEYGAAAILQEEFTAEMRMEVVSWIWLVQRQSAVLSNIWVCNWRQRWSELMKLGMRAPLLASW